MRWSGNGAGDRVRCLLYSQEPPLLFHQTGCGCGWSRKNRLHACEQIVNGGLDVQGCSFACADGLKLRPRRIASSGPNGPSIAVPSADPHSPFYRAKAEADGTAARRRRTGALFDEAFMDPAVMCLKASRLFASTREFWMRLQADYDLKVAAGVGVARGVSCSATRRFSTSFRRLARKTKCRCHGHARTVREQWIPMKFSPLRE